MSRNRRSASPILEPVPDEPAAVADLGAERALVIADYHAGYEAGLRYERGLEVPSRADERRERLRSLLERTGVDRLLVLGDLMHSIGDPGGAERGELEVLFESLPADVGVTLVKGNHDGAIETWLDPDGAERRQRDVTVVSGDGTRVGSLGICHGHTWPAPEVLAADVVCLGHEHPCVRLEDEVGGRRVEPVWLRGQLDPTPFADEYDEMTFADGPPRLVVVPAFNDLVGGTWVNVSEQSFLAPFLPDGLDAGEAYLLDGTRLGPYRSV
ncbi:metallophosphoesterase [Natrialbaceae archaeon AArc-T1-2]|uniref:metallophosphoesterase n=1 Tax=Natrialbaceae archaeon AArc-T1-2 TaxID=3053904 RepID=UPI00255B1318|nr:metallophosphoesterase [Natrialbaceae archaeon AArc-T1-2]WIV66550.1 metallophosphoesterase [Natrialbaceae archaeon AArc-T1-2]